MIQRVQSIFLLMVAICMITYLFFPIWQKVAWQENEVITINAFELVYESFDPESSDRTVIDTRSTIFISIFAILSAGIALFSISQFNNRLRQIKLGALNSLIIAATVGTAFYFIFKAEQMIAPAEQGQYLFSFYIAMVALIFNSLANRFIRKDERLVRESDRIR